jgi:hypothetical protein
MKFMEFEGQDRNDFLEVSGPDADGDFRLAVNEWGELCRVYISHDQMVRIHAFIGKLLAGETNAEII